MRAAQIRVLVRTNCNSDLTGVIYGMYRYASFYELESIENQWILCDSTMDFHAEVQL